MINVTKSFLPPLDTYVQYLERIWGNNWLTNNGPLARELESKLKEYFQVKHFFLVNNGTIALQVAIKALGLTKEIITTPYSYVATTSAILWEGCTPKYVDIDDNSYCINPDLIEENISKETEAILTTHVYGVPSDVDAIGAIAKKHNLKVIYDAAHAFGVKYKGKPLPFYGDISTLSFHATKLFHTVEGGAILTNNDELAKKIDLYRAFGHKGDEHFSLGINAKNSEFHAAMGLSLLPEIDNFIEKRKILSEYYDQHLSNLGLTKPQIPDDTEYNYAYYPVVFKSEQQALIVKQALEKHGIFPRRYFFPSLNTLPYLKKTFDCPISEKVANQVLSLPFYPDLSTREIDRITEIIIKNL